MTKIFFIAYLAIAAYSYAAGIIDWRRQGGTYASAMPQTEWSVSNRVVWATALPKWSNGTPVIAGTNIFITAEPDMLLCLNKKGEILWQKTAGYDDVMTPEEREKLPGERAAAEPFEKELKNLERSLARKRQNIIARDKAAKADPGDEEKKKAVADARAEIAPISEKITACRKELEAFPLAARYRTPEVHAANGFTSNAPLVEGDSVYVVFGSGIAASFSLDGTRRWIRLIEKPVHEWGQSGSPVLAGGVLVLQYVNTFGLDPKTGATRWQSAHPHAWGTPAVIRSASGDMLYTDGGELVSARDGVTLATNGLRAEYGSPLAVGNTVYVASGENAAAFSVTADGGKASLVKLWQTTVAKERYYATPLVHDGLVYLVNQSGFFTVLDAASGEKCYEQKLSDMGATIFPSPILAGNVVIVSSENGRSAAIAHGREYKELFRAAVDPFRSSPVCEASRMYIRCANEKGISKLYCIGE